MKGQWLAVYSGRRAAPEPLSEVENLRPGREPGPRQDLRRRQQRDVDGRRCNLPSPSRPARDPRSAPCRGSNPGPLLFLERSRSKPAHVAASTPNALRCRGRCGCRGGWCCGRSRQNLSKSQAVAPRELDKVRRTAPLSRLRRRCGSRVLTFSGPTSAASFRRTGHYPAPLATPDRKRPTRPIVPFGFALFAHREPYSRATQEHVALAHIPLTAGA